MTKAEAAIEKLAEIRKVSIEIIQWLIPREGIKYVGAFPTALMITKRHDPTLSDEEAERRARRALLSGFSCADIARKTGRMRITGMQCAMRRAVKDLEKERKVSMSQDDICPSACCCGGEGLGKLVASFGLMVWAELIAIRRSD